MPFSTTDSVVGPAAGTTGTGFGANDPVLGGTVPGAREAQSIADAWTVGMQNSATGLAVRGKLPDQQLGTDAPWYMRAASGLGNIATDLPLSIAGAVGGAVAGTAVAPGLGTAVGAGAGGFAAPMAIRDALMDAYSHNYASTWEGVQNIALSALKGAAIGGTIGAVTGGVGKVVAPFAAGAGKIGQAAAVGGAELGAMVTTSSALNGHLPTAQDFLDNAILLGGLKGAVRLSAPAATAISAKLRGIYAETGKTPAEVLADAQKDPALAAALTSDPAGLDQARKNNTFEGQAQGAGVSVGKTQPKGTPLDKLFSNFADTQKEGSLPEFRAAMFDRANGDPKAFAKDPISTTELPFGDSMTVRVEAAKSGNTRVQVIDGGEVVGAARLKKGMIDSIAVAESAKGKGIGVEMLRFMKREDIANIEEVPDRSPGFVNAQKGALSSDVGSPTSIPPQYAPLALEQRIQAAVTADPRPEALRQLMGATEPPKLGEAPINDPIKYEYITDQDTLKGVLRATEGMYQKEIDAATRGVVTNKQTAADALKLVTSGDVADRVIGTAENAAEIYARGHILKGMTENAFATLEKYRGVPEVDMTPRMKLEQLASLEQLSMALADFRGARAEAGRALQAFQKLKRDNALSGDAATIIKLYEKNGSLTDIQTALEAMKDPSQMQKFAEGYVKATTLEKVLEAWKAGILSGPQTHLANILGNAGKWLVDLPEAAISATITAGSRAIKGDPLSMAQYRARALAPLHGVSSGALDGLKIAGEVFKGKGEHLEKGDVYRTAIEGKKGEIIRIPFKLLSASDAVFRTMAERAQSHIMAVDRATKEGWSPGTREFNESVVKYTEDPTIGLSVKDGQAALEKVQQAGAEGVFSQRLGTKMETVQRALAGSPMQFIIPFFRTPANLLSWAVQHTPGLNLFSARWREDFMAGGEQRASAIARVTVGTGLAVAAYSMAQNGQLTGGGQFEKEQSGTKRAAGWQPYSIQIGDKFYSYQRFEPVAKVLGIAADLFELQKAVKDPHDSAKIATLLAAMFGNATVSTTYMSGLANAMNAVQDPNRYGAAWLEGYATSLVPKIAGQTAAAIDPNKREVDGVMEAIQSQIPFIREKLLPKRDVWGEPASNSKWFDVMPVATSEASHDLVRTEAARLHLAITDVPKYVEEKGPFNPSDKRIELTDSQRDIMRQVTGKTAMEILSPIVNSEDWKNIPDFAKGEIYRKVITDARKVAAFKALPPDDAARVIMRQKIADEVIRQVTEAQGK